MGYGLVFLLVAIYYAYQKNIHSEVLYLAMLYFADKVYEKNLLKLEQEKERLQKML